MLGDLMSSAQPIEIKVFGDDVQKLEQLSVNIADVVENVEGTADVNDGIIVSGPELIVEPKNEALALVGMTAQDLQQQVQMRIEGIVVSNMIDNEQIIDIRMMYPETYNNTIEDLKNFNIILTRWISRIYF